MWRTLSCSSSTRRQTPARRAVAVVGCGVWAGTPGSGHNIRLPTCKQRMDAAAMTAAASEARAAYTSAAASAVRDSRLLDAPAHPTGWSCCLRRAAAHQTSPPSSAPPAAGGEARARGGSHAGCRSAGVRQGADGEAGSSGPIGDVHVCGPATAARVCVSRAPRQGRAHLVVPQAVHAAGGGVDGAHHGQVLELVVGEVLQRSTAGWRLSVVVVGVVVHSSHQQLGGQLLKGLATDPAGGSMCRARPIPCRGSGPPPLGPLGRSR